MLPSLHPALKHFIIYLALPLMVVVSHFLYFMVLMKASGKRLTVSLLNMLVYPTGMSAKVSFVFALVAGKDISHWLTAVTAGVAGYYLSLLLSFVPFLAPIFREFDMEFFLLAMGCALGSLHPTPKHFFTSAGSILINNLTPLVISFMVAMACSYLVKLQTRGLFASKDKREILKTASLIFSVSAGIVSIPVAVFFMRAYLKM